MDDASPLGGQVHEPVFKSYRYRRLIFVSHIHKWGQGLEHLTIDIAQSEGGNGKKVPSSCQLPG